jgi:class 3 adenylate cyclase
VQSTICYAKTGKANIAYQVLGRGPLDVVFVPGHISNLECGWDLCWAPITNHLASFARVILFDKRGTGLSDRVSESELPTLEERMDEVRAVMDAVGSARASIVGVSEGGPMALLFAATYPRRTAALVLYASFARWTWAPDYPWGIKPDEQELIVNLVETHWGSAVGLPVVCPSAAGNPTFQEQYGRFERMAVSPAGAAALMRMAFAIDTRPVLPSVRVPTLVLHRTGDRAVSIEHGRFLAEQIPGSRFVALAGDDHDPVTVQQAHEIADEIQHFLTGVRSAANAERVLKTLLFTDIVGSTHLAETLGDSSWRELLEKHHMLVRRDILRFGGQEVQTTGDGFFAAFDGPARAIQCAAAIRSALMEIGVRIRVGIHTGECEQSHDNLAGIAVHVAARIAASAAPDEILVSSTVKDLVAGSGIQFLDRGRHALKGVGSELQLWCASP